ncbi:hypothetical protein Q3G72_020103 [Acer saccharum]|nr:hypothetical protein Q3G72_020103 [Acer saccharum]
MEQIHNFDQKPVSLIVGVTGMAGLSLAEALKSPTTLNGPWKVYGSARHSKPTWFPSAAAVDHYITFDAAEHTDTFLKSASASRLSYITLQTSTKQYMGPVFDLNHSSQLVPHDPPFHEDLPRLPYPNFYYALEDLVASHVPSLSYSVHRSSIIIGTSPRSVYNTLLTLAVYATICRHEVPLFRYPGSQYTWEHFCDMSYARVLVQQHI